MMTRHCSRAAMDARAISSAEATLAIGAESGPQARVDAPFSVNQFPLRPSDFDMRW
jgi:hypothetical protein